MDERLKQITTQILASGKITEEELKTKVDEKLKSLGGLISEEGAVHIIANDLGVSLGSAPAQTVKLKDVLAGMRNVTTLVKVLRKYEVRMFGQDGKGQVGSLFVGDDSGFMRLTFWNDKTDYLAKVNEGDILEVQSAYSKENNDRIELHMGNASHIIVNPEGKTVDVPLRAAQQEAPNKKIGDIADSDTFVQVLGTIVQAFDPRYFERTTDGKTTTNYVMNLLLDDQTGNMRATVWKEQLQTLLTLSDEEILKIRDDADSWEQIKTDLLGRIIGARARVKINEQYNTKELVLYNIEANPKPPETTQETPDTTGSQKESLEATSTSEKDKEVKPDVAVKNTKQDASEDKSKQEETPPAVKEELPTAENVTEELIGDEDEELLSIDDIDKALD
ncbi:hypothetical protein K9M74_02460 [Candidatus Woesearchaeota archaeon]|nr:hypothetical protein [Candidatus Woesearchaeota archaeon]